jgi:hypothetical protein
MLIYFIFRQTKRAKQLKAVSLMRHVTTTINSFVTGSDDIHVDSVRQVTKFGNYIKTGRWKSKKTSYTFIIKLLNALNCHTLIVQNYQLILFATFLAIRDYIFNFMAYAGGCIHGPFYSIIHLLECNPFIDINP